MTVADESAPKVTVFTPSHNVSWLDDAYESLVRQDVAEWEWIVLLNGKALNWRGAPDDRRVRVVRAQPGVRGVGALKRAACALATAAILVELDHDDLLAPRCLRLVIEAFEDPAVVLAYSDWAQIDAHGRPDRDRFDENAGWRYDQEQIEGLGGIVYDRCHAMAATPHNVAQIWFAPNHVRAFRRSTYEDVGGHDATLAILDDHDLMIRLYLVGEFRHIDECLYLQRMHTGNTQRVRKTNDAIQERTTDLYRLHVESLALAWARRLSLKCLQLRTPITESREADDRYEQIVLDPERPLLPFADDGVGVIKADDVLHRMADRAELLNESYRVLAHAGLLLTNTPSTDGRAAFQDPTARLYYNENSLIYLTQERLRHMVTGLRARLQVSHQRTYYPTEWHDALDMAYLQANLLAVKDGPRQGGPLMC